MESRGKVYDRQKEFFAEAYRTGHIGWPRTDPSRLVAMLMAAGPRSPGGLVLEIGSGEGRNLLPFLAEGKRVVALDLIHGPLVSARNRLGRTKTGAASFVQADLFALPFAEGLFDVVFDFGVFHHLRRRERGLYPRWVARVLKPGGLAGLGVFSEFFRHSPEEVRSRDFVSHRGHHDVFFREGDLPSLMGKGFRLESRNAEETGDGLSHYRLAVYRKC